MNVNQHTHSQLKLYPTVACEDGLTGATGGELWKASILLANWLSKHDVPESTIVELGSGLGLAGLAAEKAFSARVLLTDKDDAVLNNLERTVVANGSRAEVLHLDWMSPISLPLPSGSDVLFLAAACVYTPHLGIALADTIGFYASHLTCRAVIVQRADRPGFRDAFLPRITEQYGFCCELLLSPLPDDDEADGFVFLILRPPELDHTRPAPCAHEDVALTPAADPSPLQIKRASHVHTTSYRCSPAFCARSLPSNTTPALALMSQNASSSTNVHHFSCFCEARIMI